MVATGDALLAPQVTRRLIAEFARQRPRVPPRPERLAELTPRETEVLRLWSPPTSPASWRPAGRDRYSPAVRSGVRSSGSASSISLVKMRSLRL